LTGGACLAPKKAENGIARRNFCFPGSFLLPVKA
jgi:hypothetical protein